MTCHYGPKNVGVSGFCTIITNLTQFCALLRLNHINLIVRHEVENVIILRLKFQQALKQRCKSQIPRWKGVFFWEGEELTHHVSQYRAQIYRI